MSDRNFEGKKVGKQWKNTDWSVARSFTFYRYADLFVQIRNNCPVAWFLWDLWSVSDGTGAVPPMAPPRYQQNCQSLEAGSSSLNRTLSGWKSSKEKKGIKFLVLASVKEWFGSKVEPKKFTCHFDPGLHYYLSVTWDHPSKDHSLSRISTNGCQFKKAFLAPFLTGAGVVRGNHLFLR